MNRFIQKLTKPDIDGLEQIQKDTEAIAAEAKASKNWSDIEESRKLAEKIMAVLVETKPRLLTAKSALTAVKDHLDAVPWCLQD